MLQTVAYPRAALIGNPSDGYFGKTIAFVFKNFKAAAILTESKELKIIPCNRERLAFNDMSDLVEEIEQNGYYGGVRLVKATIKKFYAYCAAHEIIRPNKNFTLEYRTDIPGRLGLAGSSAIVTAAMRALMEFYGVEIPNAILANLILSVEKDELKIGAGLQDRVAQVYNAPVFMNFDKAIMQQQGYGDYRPFDKNLLPPLYIAYRETLSEGSEVTHNDLARRYAENDPKVIAAIREWSQLTEQVWDKLQSGDKNIAQLLNRNFDIRNELINVAEGNRKMVELARSAGASAKFTGSGGAIIGTYDDEVMFERLKETLDKSGITIIKPEIA